MIDRIPVPPYIHNTMGMVVVGMTLLAMLVTGYLLWKRRPATRFSTGLLIATQLSLMIQALLGIKLLDQGLGYMQLYIHYVGGLAPLLFFLLSYWLPMRDERRKQWLLFAVTGGSFLFAFMTYSIGQYYVRNPPTL